MAQSVGFEGADVLYLAPDGDTSCTDLQTFCDGAQVISCWRLSSEELAEVARTGVVWLRVAGTSVVPMHVSGTAEVLIDGHPAKAEPVLPSRPIKDRKP